MEFINIPKNESNEELDFCEKNINCSFCFNDMCEHNKGCNN